jgi:hypothetical protein
MTIEFVEMWHKRARPNPDFEQFNVQYGCHLEEIAEQLESLTGNDEYVHAALIRATAAMHKLSMILKSGEGTLFIRDRNEFLDAAADQHVTNIGATYCAHMNGPEALRRVNGSNWSKFNDDGQPIFDENGKIAKGPRYERPDLTGLY